MNVTITFTSVGADITGPFDLYSNTDPYPGGTPFETNVSLASFATPGYTSTNAPAGTTEVTCVATVGCGQVLVSCDSTTTTTTGTSSSTSTSTTSSTSSTTTTSTTSQPTTTTTTTTGEPTTTTTTTEPPLCYHIEIPDNKLTYLGADLYINRQLPGGSSEEIVYYNIPETEERIDYYVINICSIFEPLFSYGPPYNHVSIPEIEITINGICDEDTDCVSPTTTSTSSTTTTSTTWKYS